MRILASVFAGTQAVALASCAASDGFVPIGATPSPSVLPEARKSALGERAKTRLMEMVSWPRAPDDPSRTSSIDALEQALLQAGAEDVQRVVHDAIDPWSGRSIELTNLVGWVRRDASRVFVLATHYDTPPRAHADPDPTRRGERVPGANDGTSGLAVILELVGPLRAELPDDVGVAIVLFDGEELGVPGREGYCLGSRHVSQRLRNGELPELARAELGIVLDMVGDVDLRLPRDPLSTRYHPRLQNHVWQTARATGVSAFVDAMGQELVDDHVFLAQGGIPSILIIDYEFPAWHTTADDGSTISAASLAEVGEVVLSALRTWFSPGV